MKKDTCHFCGQKIDQKVWRAHAIKTAKKNGLPSLAKLLGMLPKV